MALRQSDRLRRRASEVTAETNGTTCQKVKTTMVVQGDKSGVRVLRSKDDIELMMECDDDPLTSAQLDANFRAKEAHALAMRQIKAAHEGRLSFVRGTPIIHDRPVMLQSGANTVQLSNASTGNQVIQSPARQVAGTSILNRNHVQMMRSNSGVPAGSAGMKQVVRDSNSGQNMTYILGPSKQRPTGSVPVGRVGAQPRKQFMPGVGSEVISGTHGLGVKRSFTHDESSLDSEAAFKKQKKNSHQMDQQGNWVSLDDYYYGKSEGNAWYREETGEYRFKCWYCNKMLYNNIKAMMHLQSHIDSEKQHNLDLSDLTQCKHCYKQFDTPFEMQTHIEKVHLSNSNVLMCRICEKDHDTNNQLSTHMKQNHGSCEMPYICQLCHFRSSMYSDVVDHFKKKHDSSPNLLCLYCLKVYKIKFVMNGWGITQNYYHHLVKHQSKTRSKKCTSCKLAFFTPQELKTHKKRDHAPNPRAMCMSLDSKGTSQEPVMIKVPQRNVQGGVKSLNAPAVMKNLDLSRLQLPGFVSDFHCFECKGSMSNMDHFKKYTECSMCRYATSCSSAFANHMMSFHSGRNMLRVFLTVPEERPLEARRYCLCGFSSRFGNKIANHMVFCYKRTCYAKKPNLVKEEEEREMDPRRRPGASILDALGLVKKQTAKRSADLEAASTEALLSQFENESFVGVTNMSIAQVLSDHNKEENSDDLDYEVEEEVPSDDDDDDYKPGRFAMSPKTSKGRRSRSGTMLVKLNFGKTKSKKNKTHAENGAALSEGPPGGTSGVTDPANDTVKPISDSVSPGNQSAARDSKFSSQSDAKERVQSDQSESAKDFLNPVKSETVDKDKKTENLLSKTENRTEETTSEVQKLEGEKKPDIVSRADGFQSRKGDNCSGDKEEDKKGDLENQNSGGSNEETVEDTSTDDVSNAVSSLMEGESEDRTEEGKDGEAGEADVLETPMEAESATGEVAVEEAGEVEELEEDRKRKDKTEEKEGDELEETSEAKNDRTEDGKESVHSDKERVQDIEDSVQGEDESVQDVEESVPAEEESVQAEEVTAQAAEETEEVKEVSESDKATEVEESMEKDNQRAQEEDMETDPVPEEVTMAVDVSEERLKGDNHREDLSSTSGQGVPEEAENPANPDRKPDTVDIPETLRQKPSIVERNQNNFESRIDKPSVGSAERWNSGGDYSQRVSSETSDSRSSSSDHRHHSKSSHDKSDRRHSSSGSYHRDRSHDGHHGNRRDRENPYRDRSSGRYDERGHFSRDHSRYDNRGHGNRNHGGHSNRDRYHDNRHYDNRHQDRGYRKDFRGHGSWQGRGDSSGGYYSNERRDYH